MKKSNEVVLSKTTAYAVGIALFVAVLNSVNQLIEIWPF